MHVITIVMKEKKYTFGPYATHPQAEEALGIIESHLHQGKALLYRIDQEPAGTRSVLALGNYQPPNA